MDRKNKIQNSRHPIELKSPLFFRKPSIYRKEMVLLHQRGALHQRLLYRYSASGDDVPDALLEEGLPVSSTPLLYPFGAVQTWGIKIVQTHISAVLKGWHGMTYDLSDPFDFDVHQSAGLAWRPASRWPSPAAADSDPPAPTDHTSPFWHLCSAPDLGAVGIAFWLGKNIKKNLKTESFRANPKQINDSNSIHIPFWKPELDSLVNWNDNVEVGRFGKNVATPSSWRW